ncbi:hypothetical protein [Enterococcus sp. AZ163]
MISKILEIATKGAIAGTFVKEYKGVKKITKNYLQIYACVV